MQRKPRKPGSNKAETVQPVGVQAAFDFGPGFAPPTVIPEKPRRSREPDIIHATDVLEPVEVRRIPDDRVEEVAGSKHTHIFSLYLRSQEMMMRSLRSFGVCAVLIVLIKGGVPIQEVGFGGLKLPPTSQFLTGILGLLSVMFAVAVVLYAIRSWDLLRLSAIPLQKTRTMISKALFVLQASAFALALAVVVLFTYRDIYVLLRLIFFNAIVYPDGIPGWQ
jgi:hypothetical protein